MTVAFSALNLGQPMGAEEAKAPRLLGKIRCEPLKLH